MLPFLYLLLFLLLLLTVLFSPIVIRYEKEDTRTLTLHFVFFSLALIGKNKSEAEKEDAAEEEQTAEKKKKRGTPSSRAILRAIKYAAPRGTLCIYSLPFPALESPFWGAITAGGYYFLLGLLTAPFGRRTDDPLLKAKDQRAATDLRLRLRLYAFLYTFLVYLAQYRKEKEAKAAYGGEQNE